MKVQNCILINFVTDAWTDGRTRRKQYALQLFQSWGHNNTDVSHGVRQCNVIFMLEICYKYM